VARTGGGVGEPYGDEQCEKKGRRRDMAGIKPKSHKDDCPCAVCTRANMPEMVSLLVNIQKETMEFLKKFSKKHDSTMSHIIRDALLEYRERHNLNSDVPDWLKG